MAFVNISLEEMRDFLEPQGFSCVELPGVKEKVFAKRVDFDGLALALRVYTGINPNGNSREVGEDAIRCNIFWRKEPGDMRKVASSKRVHRVAGWKKNLQDRIDNLSIEKRCSCGAPMVKRLNRGKGTTFYGCANFPECKNTTS